MKKAREQTIWDMIQAQINDPMIFILFIAASISILLREFMMRNILAVIVLNTTVGVIQEGKARRAMEALKKMTAPSAIVKRNGIYKRIPAAHLVKGDVVQLKAGNQVPADIRLLSVQGLSVRNESALTGESLPVSKTAAVMPKNLTAAERRNMAYMSSEIMKGSGEGVVTATGMDTELGKIAGMINEVTGELTPLQKRLGDLGKLLAL